MDDLIRALPGILRAAGDAQEVAEAAAFVAWRRAAGDTLRACAVPFRLYRKTLVVAVTDQTWQRQLEAISGQLLFRLNSVLGQALVTYIEFRIDPQTVNTERAQHKQLQPPPDEAARHQQEQQWLKRARPLHPAATAIHDDDLRRRFLLAAGSCIDAQDRKKPT